MNTICVNDLYLTGRFTIYDTISGHFIFTYIDDTRPGDMPPDIAVLPVLGLRTIGNLLIIDTAC